MSMLKHARMLGLAALLAAPAGIAIAQAPAPITPQVPPISMDQARRIAQDNGMMRIDEIELDDGVWEVEGRDSASAKIEINLRATDGAVIKVERERPASAAIRP